MGWELGMDVWRRGLMTRARLTGRSISDRVSFYLLPPYHIEFRALQFFRSLRITLIFRNISSEGLFG